MSSVDLLCSMMNFFLLKFHRIQAFHLFDIELKVLVENKSDCRKNQTEGLVVGRSVASS